MSTAHAATGDLYRNYSLQQQQVIMLSKPSFTHAWRGDNTTVNSTWGTELLLLYLNICTKNYIQWFILFPAGPAGKKAGCAKPFEQLSSGQLEEEPRTRQYFDYDPTEKEWLHSLKKDNTERCTMSIIYAIYQQLTSICKDYTVLDCEPLHDLKETLITCLQSYLHL